MMKVYVKYVRTILLIGICLNFSITFSMQYNNKLYSFTGSGQSPRINPNPGDFTPLPSYEQNLPIHYATRILSGVSFFGGSVFFATQDFVIKNNWPILVLAGTFSAVTFVTGEVYNYRNKRKKIETAESYLTVKK